ncbi:MAG TPA: trigger factor [Firmicutes bacterium]|nr:trigger factor [Bacillota bacterium]
MNYTIEEINKSEKKILFTVEAEIVKNAVDSELNRIRREAKVPGFRPGKTPKKVIKERFQPLALNYAQDNVIKDQLKEFFNENGHINIVSTPEVTDLEMHDDSSMTFTVKIEILPELVIEDYKNIKINRTKRIITDSDLADALKMLQDKYSTFEEKPDEPIIEGDFVNLDFQVFEGEKKIDEVKNYSFYVNSLKDIPGFEEGLLGLRSGEEKDIHIKYPDDYIRENLRNKDVVYKVHINSVKRKNIPEIDDEFVKKNFDEKKTLEEFRHDLEKQLIEDNEKIQKDEMLTQLYNYLLEHNPFDLPSNFVNEKFEQYKESEINKLTTYGYRREDILAHFAEAHIKDDFIKKLKTELVIDSLIKQENITVSDEEIDKKFEEMISKLNYDLDKITPEQLNQYKHQMHHHYSHILLNQKVEDLLISNAKIEDIDPSETEKSPEQSSD